MHSKNFRKNWIKIWSNLAHIAIMKSTSIPCSNSFTIIKVRTSGPVINNYSCTQTIYFILSCIINSWKVYVETCRLEESWIWILYTAVLWMAKTYNKTIPFNLYNIITSSSCMRFIQLTNLNYNEFTWYLTVTNVQYSTKTF